MNVTPLVFSCILYALALVLLRFRLIAAPACSFLALLVMSFFKSADGYQVLPINSSIIFGWLCITVLVTVATWLQPRAVRETSKGIIYISAGAIVGMAVGLLGFTFTSWVSALYAIMIVATAAGTFFGFLIYVSTPEGRAARPASGRFFPYLLAKGFPAAVTVMQGGVVLVLIIMVHYYSIAQP